MDEEIPPRPSSPYTLEYRRPDPVAKRSLTSLTVCFAAGVLAMLMIASFKGFYLNEFEGPDACGCMVMGPFYLWASLLIFTGACRMRRAQMMVVRPAGEVRALVCGVVCLAPMFVPSHWIPEWFGIVFLVHALVFPALGTYFIFTPGPRRVIESTLM